MLRPDALTSVATVKIAASASNDRDADYEQIVLEIMAEAERLDAEEDAQHGPKRGDELPEHLQTAAGRREALRAAKQRLERAQREPSEPTDQPWAASSSLR